MFSIQMIAEKTLAYHLLSFLIMEEPLYVLLLEFSKEYGGAKYSVTTLFKTLELLVQQKYLYCISGDDGESPKLINVTEKDLVTYVKNRKEAKEVIANYPECCSEYHFFISERGIDMLKEEDKPRDVVHRRNEINEIKRRLDDRTLQLKYIDELKQSKHFHGDSSIVSENTVLPENPSDEIYGWKELLRNKKTGDLLVVHHSLRKGHPHPSLLIFF